MFKNIFSVENITVYLYAKLRPISVQAVKSKNEIGCGVVFRVNYVQKNSCPKFDTMSCIFNLDFLLLFKYYETIYFLFFFFFFSILSGRKFVNVREMTLFSYIVCFENLMGTTEKTRRWDLTRRVFFLIALSGCWK